MSRGLPWVGRVARCPIDPNGEVGVWVTRAGRLVLMCDEDNAVWFDPTALADTPATQRWEWDLEGDDAIDRPATREEIEAGGWSRYLMDER
jgi:hypothetical protein